MNSIYIITINITLNKWWIKLVYTFTIILNKKVMYTVTLSTFKNLNFCEFKNDGSISILMRLQSDSFYHGF